MPFGVPGFGEKEERILGRQLIDEATQGPNISLGVVVCDCEATLRRRNSLEGLLLPNPICHSKTQIRYFKFCTLFKIKDVVGFEVEVAKILLI